MEKGLTISCSLNKFNDEDYELGVRYSDTDGIEIDQYQSGDNLESLLEDAIIEMAQEYYNQAAELKSDEEAVEEEMSDTEYIAYLEQQIEQLQEERNSLAADNEILQRRADDAVNASMNNEPKVSKKDLDFIDELLKFWY